jgi:hypothetical protein
VRPTKSPGAVAARGASVSDQLGRRVIPDINRQQQLPQASLAQLAARGSDMTAGLDSGAPCRAPVGGAQARARTPHQQPADLLAAQEFHRIRKFVAECRRHWPGAMIVLRPDSAPSGADAPPNLNSAPGENVMSEFDPNDDTPNEEDLEACYGSKFLTATALGDRKIRTEIVRIRKQALQQQGGGTKDKFILSFATVDKEMVLNVTNKVVLVDALGRNPADWIGAGVGLYTEPTVMAGKATRGLRLRVLSKPKRPAPAPKSPPKPDSPWPDEAGDPGADFIDAAE